jgi:hypothetical protein
LLASDAPTRHKPDGGARGAMMKTLGYMIYCDGGGPMLLSDDLLYFGETTTLFPSRAEANRAIKRTIKERYEKHGHDFEAEFGKLRIKRVVG